MAENNYIDRVKIRGNTYYLRDTSLHDGSTGNLPDIDPDTDEGAFLCVVGGKWTKVIINDAEGEGF